MKEDETKSAWSVELGIYPGVLIGMRTYPGEEFSVHVLYLPFVDIALTVYK